MLWSLHRLYKFVKLRAPPLVIWLELSLFFKKMRKGEWS